MSIRLSLLWVLCASVVNCCFARAETVRCPCTRDVWLSSVGGEADTNGGKAPRIKLKIYQEFGLLDFDVSELKNKRIESATLYIATAGGEKFGGGRGTDLRWFSISSISSPWEEGLGEQYAKDEAGRGATFNEASYKTRPWTVRGSKCFDAILGNGNSVRYDVDGGNPKDGWFEIPIDKKLIEGLVAKASYGIAILDGSTGLNSNCSIATRESRNAPYLMVNYLLAKAVPPTVPENIDISPAPKEAGPETGALQVSFIVPSNVFAYRVKVNGVDVPRWEIPLARPAGEKQSFFVRSAPPESDVQLTFVSVDPAGLESDPKIVQGKSSPRISVPALPNPPPVTKTTIAATPKAWALPELCKVDPFTGEVILDPNLKTARHGNSIWNAETKTVSLSTARGEIAGFQLAFAPEQAPSDVRISIEGLGSVQPKIWREWFVKIGDQWHAEYAIPVKENSIAVPAADNKLEGQKFGVAAIDLIVPSNAQTGEMHGKIKISGVAKEEITLVLNLKIHRATIPGEMHFFPELNCYGGPGQAGSEFFLDSHRLAHYHRNVINRVPYSQNGNVHADMVPKVGGDGLVTDWAEYDKNVGPLIDGSAFKDNPRAGVPTPMIYLPLNENWPLPMRPHYQTGPLDGENWKALHDIKAKPPEQAFNEEYKRALFTCAANFVEHFERRKWNRTMVQGFLNNKWHFSKAKLGGTAWLMDEPQQWLDWQALLFYSNIFHQAFANAKSTQFVFRGDISRPQWQGSCMDGKIEILYANSEQFSMFPLMRDMKQRNKMQLICYGACNANDRSNCETTAWCLKSYCFECDGVVPWQSLGGDSAFDKGDQPDHGNSLIVDGRKRFGVNAIASFRVHAMRSGAQLAELLRLLEIKRGWGRMHSRALVSQLIPLDAQFKQGFADDAAALKFDKVSADDLARLKYGLLQLLDD